MTIEILPARLANQIAAGEVVERPASVIKELVENALDAGASTIHIDVDKGGVKKIRISDNGCGIAKDELTLALSRHATSKIKDLSDLEAIDSLGFRGEALASISSVARLTLTSKPASQEMAWQANAEGRDMAVTIKPAAHPNGTTIEVLDLFFNTPARRKFLRTEKTEFNHIDEVVRRIALAYFDVTFTLTHNSKMIRQYRAAQTQAQNAKRVAMVCGQKFIEHAIEVDCQHDDMKFSGWLAKPSYARNQNDLCYSYVNGRMMRDKLINHAIRQAYAELLPPDTYPAFVLFLTLNHREVDVNVHPAKHEVRFHQSRYVHDFIYSVCHQALLDNNVNDAHQSHDEVNPIQSSTEGSATVNYQRPDYVQPLQQVTEVNYTPKQSYSNGGMANRINERTPSAVASSNYQQLMSVPNETEVLAAEENHVPNLVRENSAPFFLSIEQHKYGVIKQPQGLCLLPLVPVGYEIQKILISQLWHKDQAGLINQPLLLPLSLTLTHAQWRLVQTQQAQLQQAGIGVELLSKDKVQIRQYPALLRENDVHSSFVAIIDFISIKLGEDPEINADDVHIAAIASVIADQDYTEAQAEELWFSAKKHLSAQIIQRLLLKCVAIDLTSHIKQLESVALK